MYRLVVLGFVFGAVSLSQAQLSYAKIDVPGAVGTQARGINNFGEIVGFYKTVACQDLDLQVPSCPTKGFKYVNHTFVKLMVPNSTSTAIVGVNDNGDLVGTYTGQDGSLHGFIWWHNNVIQKLAAFPMAINKSDKVVGTGASGGFEWSNGKFTTINFGTAGCGTCTSLNAISNSGIIAGQAFRFDFWTGVFKQGSDNDFFKFKGLDTRFTGVNNKADIVGFGAGGAQGFYVFNIEANEGTSDATETKPTYHFLQFPGATDTVPFAINDVRGIVGTYLDSSGNEHGFLAK